MIPLPAQSLRINRATRAVAADDVPYVAAAMTALLPCEAFDPGFAGQCLRTTYFDTPRFDLRKARKQGDAYLTLRVRGYQSPGGAGIAHALSAKTEATKWRVEIAPEVAATLLAGAGLDAVLGALLPDDLFARLQELAADQPLLPVVTVACRRYAVENDRDRLTLDLDARTDTGKALPFGVLEFKSTDPMADLPPALVRPCLRPTKLSKFLWALSI